MNYLASFYLNHIIDFITHQFSYTLFFLLIAQSRHTFNLTLLFSYLPYSLCIYCTSILSLEQFE